MTQVVPTYKEYLIMEKKIHKCTFKAALYGSVQG